MTAEPEIDYRRIGELADEFTALWERLQAFYLDSVVGFHYVTEQLRQDQLRARSFVAGSDLDSESFQDTRLFGYEGILPDNFCTSGIHHATQGEVKARNAVNGENYNSLGQLCLNAFYDFWQDYLRAEYVKAKGLYDPARHDECLRQHASIDLWGDIRLLRNSIVHHRGIAKDDIARCKLIKVFKPKDRIEIYPDLMRDIFLKLLNYRNQLYKEQFEPTFIKLGG